MLTAIQQCVDAHKKQMDREAACKKKYRVRLQNMHAFQINTSSFNMSHITLQLSADKSLNRRNSFEICYWAYQTVFQVPSSVLSF